MLRKKNKIGKIETQVAGEYWEGYKATWSEEMEKSSQESRGMAKYLKGGKAVLIGVKYLRK